MSSSDEPPVFEFGDRTVFQLRNQTFAPAQEEFGTVISSPPAPAEEEFGTRISSPLQETPEISLATVAIPMPAEVEDPLVRVEAKLDAALQAIAQLQHRLDSLDATLARVLMR